VSVAPGIDGAVRVKAGKRIVPTLLGTTPEFFDATFQRSGRLDEDDDQQRGES
jgi:hypothetical protein